MRETACPWYAKQAEFDGKVIGLTDRALLDDTHRGGPQVRYIVWVTGPLIPCTGGCVYVHRHHGPTKDVYVGDSLEAAEAAYAELESQLLGGTLKIR